MNTKIFRYSLSSFQVSYNQLSQSRLRKLSDHSAQHFTNRKSNTAIFRTESLRNYTKECHTIVVSYQQKKFIAKWRYRIVMIEKVLPVVFPDLGGPTMETVTGTEGPGGDWEMNLWGFSINKFLCRSEEGKYTWLWYITGNCCVLYKVIGGNTLMESFINWTNKQGSYNIRKKIQTEIP